MIPEQLMSLSRVLLTLRRSVALVTTVLLASGCSDRPLPIAPSAAGPQLAAALGSASASGVVISQVYGGGGNSGAPYTNDFVELFNAGTGPVSIAGWSIQYASATGTGALGANAGQLVALAGSIAPGTYHLVQLGGGVTGVALPTPDVTGTINMSASSGKVALVRQATGLGCNGGSTPCDAAQLALIEDLVGFGSANFFEGTATPTLSNTTAALRKANGAQDTDNNAADFEVGAPTPRNSSFGGGGGDDDDDSDPIACATPFTPIFAIQGNGAAAAITGEVVTRGVVVGDYEGPSPALRGFYLQDATGDGNAATSDGIFVFNGNNNSVSLGDVVLVAGSAAEFQGQTQISATTVTVCGTGTVTPVDVTLPVPSADYLERVEGMLVRFPQTLTVTEHFQLGRFGQVVMSSNGRLAQPTNVVAPGAAALALQAQNDLNRLIVDDALQNQNADPILFGRGGNPLSASNTLRGGDHATGMVGVLSYTWAGNSASGNAYRLRPVGALGGGVPNFIAANARPAVPAPVGGTLKVASFNVLNYFNTFGNANCTNGTAGATTDCRGANNATEFERQRAKTVAALTTMDADIVGLMEIENDGYGATSAVQDLVNALNDATAPGRYAFIDADGGTGELNALGTDAIKVALIYQPAKVTPTGRTAALNTTSFVTGGDADARNRPALAQAFKRADGGRLVVAVNHLKSKGSACDAPDLGDGQGNCAAVRTAAAQELVAWLAADPTDTGELDALIIGDLNSYAMEDPITAIRNAGYTNLISAFGGPTAYGYAFDGQWGYLDHALASATLAAQVTGVTEWHINADEPVALDYNTEFKSAGQVTSLFAADLFRSSDHDPVIVGLNLTPPSASYTFGGFLAPIRGGTTMTVADAGSTIPVRFSLGGDQGSSIFLAGFPASRPVSCSTGEVLGGFTTARNPGGSALSYGRGNRVYHFGWKTELAWAGSCRELVLRFQDETQETFVADFRN
jgi:predicted extracellular nuclease